MTTPSTGSFLTPQDREQIRSRVSLEEVLRDYDVHLIPSGRKLKALCPFHEEKTPSFWVDVDKQLYYCFGCEAGGDVFRFVQDMDRVAFPEAVEILARRAGIVLDKRPRSRESRESERQRLGLYDALEFAAAYFRRVLVEHPRAAAAREYLDRRRIREDSRERFRIGYSLPDWDGLLNAATRAGHSPQALERAGLVRPRTSAPREELDGLRGCGGSAPDSGCYSGYFDGFRGRVMFPIADAQGRVIGFGARTLGDDVPKYINTPATALFDKSQVLYGLSQARSGIRRAGAIAVVEGYTDAIMAHQEGLDFFVASLGTAFTPENARALRRLAPRVFLVFDGDAAGQKASERSLDLLVSEDLDVRVYTVTEGKDPCDAILALGGERFRRSLEAECLDLFEFKWRATVGAEEAQGSAQARAHAVEAFLRLLARVRNPVTRRLILREYTERLGLRDEDVEAMVEKAVDEVARAGRQRLGPSTAPRAQRTAAAPAGAAGAREAVSRSPGAFEPLAEVVLECLLALPREAREIWARVPRGLFRGATGEALWRGVEEELRREVFSGVELARSLSDREAHRLVVRILSRLEPENEEGDMAADYRSIWASCQRDLRRWEIRSRVSELESALSKLAMQDAAGAASSARSGERSAQRETLLRELTSLRKELKKKWTTSSSS